MQKDAIKEEKLEKERRREIKRKKRGKEGQREREPEKEVDQEKEKDNEEVLSSMGRRDFEFHYVAWPWILKLKLNHYLVFLQNKKCFMFSQNKSCRQIWSLHLFCMQATADHLRTPSSQKPHIF